MSAFTLTAPGPEPVPAQPDEPRVSETDLEQRGQLTLLAA